MILVISTNGAGGEVFEVLTIKIKNVEQIIVSALSDDSPVNYEEIDIVSVIFKLNEMMKFWHFSSFPRLIYIFGNVYI